MPTTTPTRFSLHDMPTHRFARELPLGEIAHPRQGWPFPVATGYRALQTPAQASRCETHASRMSSFVT